MGGGQYIFWKTLDIGLGSYSNNLSTVYKDGLRLSIQDVKDALANFCSALRSPPSSEGSPSLAVDVACGSGQVSLSF